MQQPWRSDYQPEPRHPSRGSAASAHTVTALKCVDRILTDIAHKNVIQPFIPINFSRWASIGLLREMWQIPHHLFECILQQREFQ